LTQDTSGGAPIQWQCGRSRLPARMPSLNGDQIPDLANKITLIKPTSGNAIWHAERVSGDARFPCARSAGHPAVVAKGLAIAAALVIAALLSACGSDQENDRRLHILQQDQFLQCRVDGTKPWTVLDRAGTTHGIGFGDRSPTLVLRDLRLTGNVDRVTTQLSTCAAQAGWPVHPFTTGIAGFWARKRFEDRWNATLHVYVGDHILRQQPAVEIRIETGLVQPRQMQIVILTAKMQVRAA
jgi:hypothetical protein